MSEIRAVVSVPTAANFGGMGAVTPCAPLLVNSTTGEIYSITAAGTVVGMGVGGTVTSVTGTAPIASSGGNTPAISLNANGVTPAYLSGDIFAFAAAQG